MNKTATTFMLIMAFVGISFYIGQEAHTSSSGGPAGHTGSPGDGASCANCHAGGTSSGKTADITSDIPPTGYVPGTTYTITATATSSATSKFGFQISPQNIAGNLLGTLVNTSAQTQLVGSSKYITHTSGGTSGAGSKTWSFNWVAPAQGTGNVTFYGAFNFTNNNNAVSGDYILTMSYVVNEAPANSITTNSISPSSYCRGSNISVSYTANGTYNAGNIFEAQLSNGFGNFSSPTVIGTVSATSSGVINALIPVNTPEGFGYRVRVVSNNPVTIGSDNGNNIQIYAQRFANPATNNNFICPGDSTEITANVGLPVTGYQWLLNNNAISGATNAFYYATQAGNYSVIVFNGPCADTSSVIVINQHPLPPQPTITQNGNDLTCNENGYNYQWLLNGTPISGANTQTYTVLQNGNYSVQIIDNNGCSNTSNVLTINSFIHNIIVDSLSNNSFCAEDSIIIYYSVNGVYNAGNIFTAQLSDGAGSFANSVNIGSVASVSSGFISTTIPSNALSANGYRIRVVSSDPLIIGTDNGNNIMIREKPTMAILLGSDNICDGDSTSLIIFSCTGCTYQLFLNNNPISTVASNIVFNISQAGIYHADYYTGNCIYKSPTDTLNVLSLPPVPTITQNGNQLICNENASSYQWYVNGNSIAGANSQTYNPTQSGNYTVEITNSAGCKNISLPHNFIPDGIDELTEKTVVIYPNPLSKGEALLLNTSNINKLNIQIVAVTGYEILNCSYDIATQYHTQKIEIPDVSRGMYIVKISTPDAELVKKIIVN